MTKIKWQHPSERGETVRQRLERLWKFVSFYDRNPPVSPGQHIQLSRYLSEIQFLEQQDGKK